MRSKGTKGSKGSRFRKLVKARVAKTGESWAAAVRSVRAARETNGSVAPEQQPASMGGAPPAVPGFDPLAGLKAIPGFEPLAGLKAIPGFDPLAGLKAIPGFEPLAGLKALSEFDPTAGLKALSEFDPTAGLKTLSKFDPTAGLKALSEFDPTAGLKALSKFDPMAGLKALSEFDPTAGLKTLSKFDPMAGLKALSGLEPPSGLASSPGREPSPEPAHLNPTEQDRLTALPIGHRTVEELLALLRTPSTFAVMVGRVRSPASADPFVVAKTTDDLARNPMYHAWTGGSDLTVSLDEYKRLSTAGAIGERKGQILRSKRFVESPLERVTFSDQCKCRRWIWCGATDRESTCVCGRTYRVSFDLAGDLAWAKHQYQRCADCGIEFAMHPVAEGVSPWRALNEWQVQCNNCHLEEERGPTAPPAAPAAPAAPSAALLAGGVTDFVQPTDPPRIRSSRLNGALRSRRRHRVS